VVKTHFSKKLKKKDLGLNKKKRLKLNKKKLGRIKKKIKKMVL
jgi:hypothetical protein